VLTAQAFYFFVSRKKYLFFAAALFLITLFFQWKTTTFQSLVLLDNDEQRIHSLRLEFYKPSLHYVRVIFHRFNLVDFLEGDFTTGASRIERNLFETIDPNVYFFAGHPRERIWASDFEKFPFLFLFPFLIGLYNLILSKKRLLFFTLGVSTALLSIIGHQNSLGPFILFPFLVVITSNGLLIILKKLHV